MSDIFIHYGSPNLELHRIYPIKNKPLTSFGTKQKPFGGFWASPVNSIYGWYDWNMESNYCTDLLKYNFLVGLQRNPKIYIIDSYKDLEKLPVRTINIDGYYLLDFEVISKEYDIIWLTLRGIQTTNDPLMPLNLCGWDCESLLIMNKKKIYQYAR